MSLGACIPLVQLWLFAAGGAARVDGSAVGRAASVELELAAGGAAIVGCRTAGRAVEVNCSAAGKAAIVKLDMLQAGAAEVCSSSSTVLAAVTIVVEHRARLLVV